ncbi:MAG TPA: DUF1292 domain-containing protein [Tenericutes bacterium]|nr:DUF1292 domain-containing protein [Mycoplasmatota bacterium]
MDTMTLNKLDGTTEEVEIMMTFKLERFNDNDYVIYKSLDKFYAARYVENNGITNLETNLSEDEKEDLSKVFNKLREGGII